MSHNVHRLEMHMERDASKLEGLLNGITGEVVSIIPNVKKTTLAQIQRIDPKGRFPPHR